MSNEDGCEHSLLLTPNALVPKYLSVSAKKHTIEKAILAEIDYLVHRTHYFLIERSRLETLHDMVEIWLDLIECELRSRRDHKLFQRYQDFLERYESKEFIYGPPVERSAE